MGISGNNYFFIFSPSHFSPIYVNNIPKKGIQAKTPGKWGKKRLKILP